jgi:predicted transcriptional regulator
LADRMPAKIEVPVSPVRRDDEIRALAAGGVTQAKIAERFGVSQQAVSKILRREAA